MKRRVAFCRIDFLSKCWSWKLLALFSKWNQSIRNSLFQLYFLFLFSELFVAAWSSFNSFVFLSPPSLILPMHMHSLIKPCKNSVLSILMCFYVRLYQHCFVGYVIQCSDVHVPIYTKVTFLHTSTSVRSGSVYCGLDSELAKWA